MPPGEKENHLQNAPLEEGNPQPPSQCPSQLGLSQAIALRQPWNSMSCGSIVVLGPRQAGKNWDVMNLIFI